MGMPVGRAQNTQNHKSGHSDKDSSWTVISAGPLPIVDYKNSEFHPFDTGAWLYHRSCSELIGLPLHQTSATIVAIWLRPMPASPSLGTASDQDFRLDACSAPFYIVKLPLSV